MQTERGGLILTVGYRIIDEYQAETFLRRGYGGPIEQLEILFTTQYLIVSQGRGREAKLLFRQGKRSAPMSPFFTEEDLPMSASYYERPPEFPWEHVKDDKNK